jgi:uncharacterized RDD family membrane protein YckC
MSQPPLPPNPDTPQPYGSQPPAPPSYGAPYGGPAPAPYEQSPPPYQQPVSPYGTPPAGSAPYGQPAMGYPPAQLRPPIPGVVADLGQRALARILDSVIVIVGAFVLALLLVGGGAATGNRNGAAAGAGVFTLFLLSPIILFLYEWLSALYWGGTLGKKLVRIKIVNEATGGRPSATEALVRALLPSALTYLCGIGLLCYISPAFDGSGRLQGWHDRAGKTAVIKA